MYEGMLAETVSVLAHGGDDIAAYLARPLGGGAFPGIVVIHHAPGWDEATKAITRRFAHHGYAAICPHLHYREGRDLSPDDAAAAVRAAGGVPDDRFLGDAAAALRYLRSAPYCSGRVACIGYCSGGRQAFLAAAELPFDAAIDCYGAGVAAPLPSAASKAGPVLDRASGIQGPLLGLFGADDQHPAPAEVEEIDAELTRLGKTHEFHTFPNAGHGFFATDRAMYRVEAANEGWRLIFDFLARTVG